MQSGGSRSSDAASKSAEAILTLTDAAFTSAMDEEAIEAIKSGDPRGILMARQTLKEILAPSVTDALARSMTSVSEELEKLREVVEGLVAKQSRIAGTTGDLLSLFGPDNQFMERYTHDDPQPNRALARYVCNSFVTDRLRAFVLASTFAIHFGSEIAEKMAFGCLFYTNSTVFPLIVLQSHSRHAVYSFCGTRYDPTCAGWLFGSDDVVAKNELRSLFFRMTDPLTTAFVAPAAVTLDAGQLFVSAESADFAATLTECAAHTAVLTTSDRIFETQNDLPSMVRLFSASGPCPWAELPLSGQRISIVIAMGRQRRNLGGIEKSLSQFGFEVHVQEETGEWVVR